CRRYITISCMSFFFFFSSRRRHTRCLSDWSSDVCSSDLHHAAQDEERDELRLGPSRDDGHHREDEPLEPVLRQGQPRELAGGDRSEERRVGKEWRCRWAAEQ